MNPANNRRESRRESGHSPNRSRSESLASIASTASHKGPPLSATPSSRSIQSVHREQSVSKVPPKKPTQSQKVPPTQPVQVSKKIKIHASVKRRAEGRAKVPKRLSDSVKNFFFLPTGMLKILRMCIIAASVYCFTIDGTQEVFIAITIEETCIVLFFIIIYLVTLQHLLICIHWPLLDLINSFISAVFLGGVALMTIPEKEEKRMCYVGGILCLLAAVLCVGDMLVTIKKMMKDKKKGPESVN